jgi:hypothetical protein
VDEASQGRQAPKGEAEDGTSPHLSQSAAEGLAADEESFLTEVGLFELDDEEPDEADTERSETLDDQGRRHVRLAAPEGTEEILEKEAARKTGLPDWAERWRARSATGSVLTAVAFGLKEVFEPERKEPAIVMETSGDPPKDLPVEAKLEQLGPRQSSVMVRPWLLATGEGDADGATDEGEAGRS